MPPPPSIPVPSQTTGTRPGFQAPCTVAAPGGGAGTGAHFHGGGAGAATDGQVQGRGAGRRPWGQRGRSAGTSFVPAAATLIEGDSTDEEEADEEGEQLAPLSTSTPRSNARKRASSTSTTARGPSKRSKIPAVRSADSIMTHRNKLMSKRNALIQDLRRKREEMEEAARTEHRTRVQKVHQLAADLGVSRVDSTLVSRSNAHSGE
ncbi:hypothetical protein PVAP13_9KG387101 [Panicum virgatum]|uniref:Uncharacterized protein n=1 Tax=Panicum virgatum TaxID=38727 RepID=A0A8T0NPD0_PANVG|nr:hypothetical protein PVAP13_9KG387101 [Panicum virgatum]